MSGIERMQGTGNEKLIADIVSEDISPPQNAKEKIPEIVSLIKQESTIFPDYLRNLAKKTEIALKNTI